MGDVAAGITWWDVREQSTALRARFDEPVDDAAVERELHAASGFTLTRLLGQRRWRPGVRMEVVDRSASVAVTTRGLTVRYDAGALDVPLHEVFMASEMVKREYPAMLRAAGHERAFLLAGGGSPRDGTQGPAQAALLLVVAAALWARSSATGQSTSSAEDLWAIAHRKALTLTRPA